MTLLSLPAGATEPLPEGHAGIAAQYPHDLGIGDAPEVLFADDFESYDDASQLPSQWDAVWHAAHTRIATEPENRYSGRAALEFEVPQRDTPLSNTAAKFVAPPRDVLFLRYYSKFESTFDAVGSSHNGSSISASYFVDGQATPGIPADGTNKFLANLENWRGPDSDIESPGAFNIYIYHPEQRSEFGDHFFPTGVVLPFSSQTFDFGSRFVPRDDIVPELDRWYCHEFMVKANTPGQRDGRIAYWIDGVLAADFHNLRLRDVDTLQIDRFAVGLHIGKNPVHTRKWYDNVVAATEYIGPMFVPPSGETTGDDETGDASSGSGDLPDADATGGGESADSSAGEAESGVATEPSTPSQSDGGSTCTCSESGSRQASWIMLGSLAGLGLRRRRRWRAQGGQNESTSSLSS